MLSILSHCHHSMNHLNSAQVSAEVHTHLYHMHTSYMHGTPTTGPTTLYTRHLMSDHTPWYEQTGSIRTHRSEVESLQHGFLELQSVAW